MPTHGHNAAHEAMVQLSGAAPDYDLSDLPGFNDCRATQIQRIASGGVTRRLRRVCRRRGAAVAFERIAAPQRAGRGHRRMVGLPLCRSGASLPYTGLRFLHGPGGRDVPDVEGLCLSGRGAGRAGPGLGGQGGLGLGWRAPFHPRRDHPPGEPDVRTDPPSGSGGPRQRSPSALAGRGGPWCGATVSPREPGPAFGPRSRGTYDRAHRGTKRGLTGAGGGNRTRVSCLEGKGLTITQRPLNGWLATPSHGRRQDRVPRVGLWWLRLGRRIAGSAWGKPHRRAGDVIDTLQEIT